MEMKMKYHNGKIILSAKENQLLASFTDKSEYEPEEVQHFVCMMHLLKHQLTCLLEKFQCEPEYAANEQSVRSNMYVMMLSLDQLRERAVALARQAGVQLVLE